MPGTDLPALTIAAALVAGLWLAAAVVAIVRARGAGAPARRAAAAAADAPPPPRDWADELAARLRRLPETLWWRDAELNLIGVNDAYARAVGAASPDEAVRRGLELAPGARALAARARARRRSLIAREQVAGAEGARMVDLVHVPVGGGEVIGFTLDGFEHQAAPDAAADRAGALGDALDELPDAVAIFDASRALWFNNRAFAELFELDPLWLAGHPDFDQLLDAMRDARRLPERSDFAAWRAGQRRWFAQSARASEEVWTLPAGEVIRVVARPRGDGRLMLIFEDQTERVLLAGTRDQLLKVHQATLDHLNDGVAVFGPDGQLKLFNRSFARIVLVSPEELTARPSAEALMAHVAELLREPERARGLRDLIVSATAGRAARSGRVASTLGYVLDYSSVPLPDGNALLTFTDVTARIGAAAPAGVDA